MADASRDAAPPRLLLHTAHFAPNSAAAEFASWLVARDAVVEVVAADAGGGWWRVEECGGVRINYCPQRSAPYSRGPARRLEHASFALSSAPIVLRRALAMRPRLLGAFELSPGQLLPALVVARQVAGRSWAHLAEGTTLDGERAGGRFLHSFDFVSLAAMNALEVLAGAGIAPERRLALLPWIDTRAIYPLPTPSPLRAGLHLGDDAIVVLYAGSLDERHRMDLLIDVARRLPPNGAVTFVVSGRGSAWRQLAAATHSLPLRLLPWMRPDQLNAVLNLADIHVLPAGLDAADDLFPAKPAALLASGRPILALGNVPERLGNAMVSAAGGASGLAAAIVALAAAPAEQLRRGAAARRAAQDYHEKQRVFRHLERALGLRGVVATEAVAR
jgi:colanic acid biosynthesis glycosyl transferase WcaI